MAIAVSARPNRTTRAELKEAMNQARPLAAQLRAAIEKKVALGPAPKLKSVGALRETIASLRADIRSIADRAYLEDEDILIFLLDEEHRLRTSCRRIPTVDQLRRAIGRGIGDAERSLHAAHEAVTEAQRKLEDATRTAIVSAAAGNLLRSAA